ncbi:MAG: LytTR family transcriptional regulator [Betaproteobacteria bacterium]|nr:LytTR family transcriptional regulator [Betaproteobacteria bacterium]
MKTCSHADTSQKQTNAKVNSWLYLLERFDVGVVHLDSNIRVLGMNDYARRCLPVQEKMPFGKIVTDFHPEAARPKVKFLLGQAECPVNNAPPMAMMINIPERVLLIKVSKLSDELGAATGYTLVFYDITEVVSQEVDDAPGAKGQEVVKRQFRKIPTVKQNRVLLVDVQSVSFIRSEGHYTWVHTAQGGQFCNLTIGDLESRLDPHCFLRVHRSYIVNLSQVDEIVRDDGRMTLRMMGSTPVEIPVSRSSVARLMDQLGLTDAISAKV